jgi:hypothetical protein
MENTYTYTARNIENLQQVVMFTLQNHHLSVGIGAPIEQIEAALDQFGNKEESAEALSQLWLRPLAVSLLERGVGPFRIDDVNAVFSDGCLTVSAWYRTGGLALAPVTLIKGQVDNPPAARAFIKELNNRKGRLDTPPVPMKILDYWITWVAAGIAGVALFQIWRRRIQA